jgi:uncharacterized protein YcfL
MKRILLTGLCLTLLAFTGCSASSPEALAEEAAAALKSGNIEKIIKIAEQVEKLSGSDKQKYEEALGKIMLKEMGGGMGMPKMNFPGGGDIPNPFGK